VKKEESEPTINKVEFQSLLNNLSIVGIPSTAISESDFRKHKGLLELLVSKADSIVDLGTDFRVSMGGSTVNVGKEIMNLLSDQYHQIKGGG
jgi:hypothetical protein